MRSDPQQMHHVADGLSSTGHDLAEMIDALSHDADSVMSSDWTGNASASHRILWTEWVDSARAVVAALVADADFLHRAAAGYQHTDDASAARTLSLGYLS